MRVLLAGAGGALGLPLIERLHADGHEVTVLTRSPDRGRAIRRAGGEAVMCDVLLERQLTEAVERVQPEAIVHELTTVPARVDVHQQVDELVAVSERRVQEAVNLLVAARAAEVGRFLAQSVTFAYAAGGDWVKDESAPLDVGASGWRGALAAAVAELERQVLDHQGMVLRYGHLYGPETRFSLRGAYAELARRRQLPLVASGEGRWSFVHVRDAAEATALALEQKPDGVLNVVDDDPAPGHQWVPVFAAAVGAKRPLKVPDALAARWLGEELLGAMSQDRGASNAKARAQLGWNPGYPSWREGFAASVAVENRERWRWAR